MSKAERLFLPVYFLLLLIFQFTILLGFILTSVR